jgi:hypothetical protein
VGAIWHHPRFSSGTKHGSDRAVTPFWEVLQDAGAEWVVTGHEHLYERFAPQDAAGRPDPDGIRSFVVGTGGKSVYEFDDPLPNSDARAEGINGVLELTLFDDRYAWRFVSAKTAAVADAGNASCSPA